MRASQTSRSSACLSQRHRVRLAGLSTSVTGWTMTFSLLRLPDCGRRLSGAGRGATSGNITGENQSSHAGEGRGSSVAKMSSPWWMSWRAFRVFPNRVSTSASVASSQTSISGDAGPRRTNARAARILSRASSARLGSPENAGMNAMCASTAEPSNGSCASCAAWSAITILACAFTGSCRSKNSMRPASRLDSLTAAASERRAASRTEGTRRAPRWTCAATTSCNCADGTVQYICRCAVVTEM